MRWDCSGSRTRCARTIRRVADTGSSCALPRASGAMVCIRSTCRLSASRSRRSSVTSSSRNASSKGAADERDVAPEREPRDESHRDLQPERRAARREERLEDPGDAERGNDEEHDADSLRARQAQSVAAAPITRPKERPREAEAGAAGKDDARDLKRAVGRREGEETAGEA